MEVFGCSVPPVIRLWIGEVGVHHLTGPHLIYQYNRFVQTKEWSVVVVVAMGELPEKLNSLLTYPTFRDILELQNLFFLYMHTPPIFLIRTLHKIMNKGLNELRYVLFWEWLWAVLKVPGFQYPYPSLYGVALVVLDKHLLSESIIVRRILTRLLTAADTAVLYNGITHIE